MAENIIWGYARVSSTSQNLDRQLDALRAMGIDERYILSEKKSGKDFERPAFLSLVGTDTVAPSLRAGDCLVITSLDRLGRNYTEIRNWWTYIVDVLHCDIIVLDMTMLNTKQADSSLDNRFVSDLVLQILSYVSEKERNSIRERQRQGIQAAMERGAQLGRSRIEKPEGFDEAAERWRRKEITAVDAMRELHISKYAFYKLIKEENHE